MKNRLFSVVFFILLLLGSLLAPIGIAANKENVLSNFNQTDYDSISEESEMSTYFIAKFTVTDSEKFQEYRGLFLETIKPLMQKYEAKMIVMTTKETLGVKEGTPADKLVVIKFKNREIADTWYHSDEYQATIQTRLDSTKDSWLTITDQFIPPAAS